MTEGKMGPPDGMGWEQGQKGGGQARVLARPQHPHPDCGLPVTSASPSAATTPATAAAEAGKARRSRDVPHAVQAGQVHQAQHRQPLQHARRLARVPAGRHRRQQHPVCWDEAKQVCRKVGFQVLPGHGCGAVHQHLPLEIRLQQEAGRAKQASASGWRCCAQPPPATAQLARWQEQQRRRHGSCWCRHRSSCGRRRPVVGTLPGLRPSLATRQACALHATRVAALPALPCCRISPAGRKPVCPGQTCRPAAG